MAPRAAFNHIFQIFFPSRCRCEDLLPEELTQRVFKETAEKMAGWFGGETDIQDTIGRYQMETGNIIKETVKSVMSFSDNENYLKYRDVFFEYARELADCLTQETIGIRVDKEMYFIPMTARKCVHGKEFSLPIDPDKHISSAAYLRVALRHTLINLHDEKSARHLVNDFWQYAPSDERINIEHWPDSVRNSLVDEASPLVIADQNGFQIILIQMKSESLSVAEERHAIELIHQPLTPWHGLFLFSNPFGTEWHFVNAKHKDPMSPTLGSCCAGCALRTTRRPILLYAAWPHWIIKILAKAVPAKPSRPHMIKRLICRA